MSATETKFDRAASVKVQTLAIVRQLLVELGGSRGLEELAARGAAAHLERELELGSLERVELMLRLSDSYGVRLPDRVVAEADTVQDLIHALVAAVPRDEARDAIGAESDRLPSRAVSDPLPTVSAPLPELEAQIQRATTLTEILRLRGLGEPDRAHIHLYQEDGQPRTISFGELYTRASAVSAELQLRGLEPGQAVAIMLPTCAEFFYTFAGILLAGGIPVPIYPPFRADRIAEYAARQSGILRNAEARFLLTFRKAEGLAHLLQPGVPTLREVLNAERLASAAESPGATPSAEWRPVQNLSHHSRADDIAFLQYTSGSTGDPKGVTLTHANLLANIRCIVAGVDLNPRDVAVSWLPLYHDMGLIGAWLVPLFSGVPVVVMSPLAFLSRPERWMWAMHDSRGTLCPAPNFSYELCARKIPAEAIEGLDLSHWRVAINAGEAVLPDTLARFEERFKPYGFRAEAFVPCYGLAESSVALSFTPMNRRPVIDTIRRDLFESEGKAVP
ncbi:MAG: AMP-binding protein, partial [Candidatus Acidiferrales bacterium]